MAIFKILLIFSAVSTFVLRSSENILDSTQRKRFLSLSPLISSSNFCVEAEIDGKRSKTPSVESWSLPLSLVRYAFNSKLISSKINAFPASTPAVTAAWDRTNFPPIFESR